MIDSYLSIVAQEVARLCDQKGIGYRDKTRRDELFGAGQLALATILNSSPSGSYVRTVVRRAIARHYQTDRQAAVPITTYKRGKRGPKPEQLPDNCDWLFAPTSQSSYDDWKEVIATYQILFSLSRDEIDRLLIYALTDGLSVDEILQQQITYPVHIADAARAVGLSESAADRRIRDLESRYYLYVRKRKPTRQRQQRRRHATQ